MKDKSLLGDREKKRERERERGGRENCYEMELMHQLNSTNASLPADRGHKRAMFQPDA